MPNKFTYPILLDKTKIISISKLKELGYLMPYCIKSGVIVWIKAGKKSGRIGIYSNMLEEPFIRLNYKTGNKPVSYEIRLVSQVSNLGKGKIWYFMCPVTNQKCKKLYKAGKYFLHRDAFPDAMYECQTYSVNQRNMNKVFDAVFGIDKYDKLLYQKYFKTHYNGKPTKKYLRILEKKNMSDKMRGKLMDYFA